MSKTLEVRIPDIGDFKEVAVIEVMVKPGDTVNAEDSIITLESDKATMDVPAPAGGIVREVKVKVGDMVAEGTLVLLLETSAAAEKATLAAVAKSAPAATAPVVAGDVQDAQVPRAQGRAGAAKVDIECEMLVLGSGPGGYSAAFRAADLGMQTVLVERYATLGGVCLNVGCIPSKALLHVAAVTEEAQQLAEHGVSFGRPSFDLDKLRGWKDKVVTRLVGGIGAMAKGRKVEVVRGVGRFLDPNHMEVALTTGEGQQPTGEKKVVRFAKAIIAAGSQAVKLPFIPEDPRIVDSTGALGLKGVPGKMLVIGGGIIGMEMATVYSALGSRLDVVEMQDGLMPGADRDLVRVWDKLNAKRFDRIMLKTRTVKVEVANEGIKVWFEGEAAPAGPQLYDFVLVATGRVPNGKRIDADKAGVTVTERGFIEVDGQMRTNVPHIYAIGDIVGQPMLAHKAVHEGKVAAEVIAGHHAAFEPLTIPSVAYTDPEIAWMGLTETQAMAQGIEYEKASFPWAASGRALSIAREEGVTKLLLDPQTRRILGAGIVGVNAGELIAEAVLALEMGADMEDIGLTIHPHPTLSETLGFAAEMAEGAITDLYMPKKKH